MAANARLKNEFTENEKYHNLKTWLKLSLSYQISRDMTKPTKWLCAQRRLRSAWASAQSDQSLLCLHEESLGPYTHWAHSKDSDQTGRMPRLIWVFAGHTHILLVLLCRGSNIHPIYFTVVILQIDPVVVSPQRGAQVTPDNTLAQNVPK